MLCTCGVALLSLGLAGCGPVGRGRGRDVGDTQGGDPGDEGPSASFEQPGPDASGSQSIPEGGAGGSSGGLGNGASTGGDTAGGASTGGDTAGGANTGGANTGGANTDGGASTGGDSTAWACVNAEDCASPTTQVCSAETHQCVAGECDGQTTCPGAAEICVGQVDQATVGACYPGCEQSVGCVGQRTCTPLDLAGNGFCQDFGQAAAGTACDSTDTTSGCGPGLTCVADDASGADGAFCRDKCDYWGQSSATCGAGSLCHPLGACLVSLSADPTTIGETCSGGTQVGTWCGTSQGRLGGACDASGACRALCRIGQNDCPAGASCEDVFGSEVGLCTLQTDGGTGTGGGTGGSTSGSSSTPTWTQDIHPISQKRCTPCHSNWFVDSYSTTKFNAGDILGSMKGGWMPPSCPQNAALCANSTERSVFEAWMNGGMPE